jgi:hypothetical protein
MDPKRVEAVTQWPQPKSVHDIQIFLGFMNFYRRFIEGYSHITRLLTELLKTSGKEGENGDGQNQPARQGPPSRAREVKHTGLSEEMPEGDGVTPLTARMEKTQKRKHKQNAKGPPFMWTDAAEKSFNWIKKSFAGAGILAHFDPRKRIRLEIDASKFAIAAILSQLQEDGQWRPVAFWWRKLILAETCYETHDQELLAIVAVFK